MVFKGGIFYAMLRYNTTRNCRDIFYRKRLHLLAEWIFKMKRTAWVKEM
jgi:hypothetical protein